jgi:hypothetical protein
VQNAIRRTANSIENSRVDPRLESDDVNAHAPDQTSAAELRRLPIQVVLPPLLPGCSALICPGPDGSIRVDVGPAPLAFTLEQACERLPNKPHPDTLRAHLERAGIPIGMCGRTPLVSEEQLRRALRLAV